MTKQTKPDRKTILLRAAYDLLTRAERASYVIEAGAIMVRYDDADCSGDCLRVDIAAEIGIDEDTDPVSLEEEPEFD